MIRKLYRYFPISTLLTVHKSFLRPYLDCDIIDHKLKTRPKEISVNLINYLPIKLKFFNIIMQTLQLQDVYKVYIHGTSKEKLRNELELTSL